ncbi:prenyltransferase/squalene oxidase repeat-containing protein [Sutcliffiella deserti]|uniref:hypothetical protein n=1 Tax=Sutcliffiella deserti TaxID=2875501 RepID=UPI001CC1059C|nr:hypothetical protein [Sutcliffiella deserti]
MNSTRLLEGLEKIDVLFDGFIPWLAGQYDSTTGGFYYARSSMNDRHFGPDIESTSQALNILIRNNLLQHMPTNMKQRMISFYQQKQHPQTGYFFDDNPAMKNDEVMVHRALSYTTGSLLKLGSAPLHPLPLVSNAAPEYVKSPESYLEKWRSIDLRNSWRGCDLLATSCVYIEEMKEEERQPFLDEAVKYLESIQDPFTGLWGEGSLYVKISGTFKLHTFYSRFNIPMPNTDKIYQSILACLRREEAHDMCYIRNPINLLSYIKPEIPQEEQEEIIRITAANMKKLKRPDGGFSRESENSPTAPNVAQVKGEYYPDMPEPVHLSQGLYEGDMNASTQAVLIRMQCYELAGETCLPVYGSSNFYKLLR